MTETAPFTFATDRFDELLNSRCSIWKKDVSGTTSYGQPIEEFVLLVDDVACYAEQTSGKELSTPPAPITETSTGIETWTIFMRPISVDAPPVPLAQSHANRWLQIKKPGDPTLDPNDPNSGAVLHKVTNCDNPGLVDHHYEVETTVLRA